MGKFDKFLRSSLAGRNRAEWRLGNLYSRKFRETLRAGVEADDTLQTAERRLTAVRARMLELARPLQAALAPAHKDHSDLSGDARINAVVGEVLASIAQRHSTRESYMDDARKDLEEARAFVQQKRLLTLPARSNLQVIPTPEFMRGIYAVGGFNAAPALEPELGAFFWVTPIPAAWPAERVESKLREYNFYKLKLLTIHEAMPGHYVQMEIANNVQPPARRILRSIYGNGAYIEGWAQYVQTQQCIQGECPGTNESKHRGERTQDQVILIAPLAVPEALAGMHFQDGDQHHGKHQQRCQWREQPQYQEQTTHKLSPGGDGGPPLGRM